MTSNPNIKIMGARMGASQRFYFDICERSYVDFREKKKLFREAKNAVAAVDVETMELDERHRLELPADRANAQATAAAATTIVFAGMCLEAAIYDFAAWQLGDAYVKKFLDKLDLVSKWMVVPKLITQREIPLAFPSYDYLKKLVTLRNDLVHHKSSEMPYDQENIIKKARELDDREESIQSGCEIAILAVILLSFDMEFILGDLSILNPLPSFSKPTAFNPREPYSDFVEELISKSRGILARSRKKSLAE